MASSQRSSRLIAEFAVIVVSILAAFAVDEFRENRADDQRRELALTNIRAELEHNISALSDVLPYHEDLASNISTFVAEPANWTGQSSFEVIAVAAPQGLRSPDLRRTSWRTAQATGAVALFDYALGQRIAGVYDLQALGVEATIARMTDQIFTVDMFRTENTEAVMTLFGALGGELFAQERRLAGTIETLLTELPEG